MKAGGQVGQWSVVRIRAAFTLEVSLLCIPGASAGPNELVVCGPSRFPFTPEASQFVH
jgi:hypothetical protein